MCIRDSFIGAGGLLSAAALRGWLEAGNEVAEYWSDYPLDQRLSMEGLLGPSWTVQEKVGRKLFSRGVWAPGVNIRAARTTLDEERADPAYEKRLTAARVRREKKQDAYVEDFRGAVLAFLDFDPRFDALAQRLADAVTTHATPVGSGTVARTERIPIDERAESAVIAWMRHQTTAYDGMVIPRIKGERRRVRRMLAERSKLLLSRYRRGEAPQEGRCPLVSALSG